MTTYSSLKGTENKNSYSYSRNSLFFQHKLTINQPNDIYEQEADAVADRVMRMPATETKPLFFQPKPIPVTPVQRKCAECVEEEKLKRKEDKEEKFLQLKPAKDFDVQRKCAECEEEKKVQMKGESGKSGGITAPPVVQDVINSSGQPLDVNTKNFMEARFGYDFGNVKVHNDSLAHRSSRGINALAYTHGNHVVFSSGQYQPDTNSGKQLLAHELTHVVQQNSDKALFIRRQNCDSPHDKMVLERAKKRLDALEPKLLALEGYQFGIESEKLRTLDDRRKIDDPGTDPTIKEKWRMEEQNLTLLNKRPVAISVSGTEIIFRIRFQVFFEDSKLKTQFDTLTKTLQAGIDLVWNHNLDKGIFSGRKFSIIPEMNLIDALTKRNHDFWLIVIRKSDKAKVSHSGCQLPDPGTTLPTSVTEPLCDGGVINIPPAHMKNAGVLGHEILHLFGLIDRYAIFTEIKPAAKKGAKPVTKVSLVPLRETAGRKDPLGAEDATILWEDLGLIFSELGVYADEIAKTTPTLLILKSEVRRLRRIVAHGCDPDSLIRIRKDFNDKIIKSAEDL